MSELTVPPRKSVVGRPRTVPYLVAGVLGGFLAGVGFIALTSWFVSSTGSPALAPFRVIASIVQGPAAVEAGTADLWVGMVVHSVLAAAFGLVFALLTLWMRSPSLVAVAGILYGAAIYVVNFQVLARVFEQLSAFRGVNQPFEATVHIVFGALLAVLVLWGARRDAGLQPVAVREQDSDEGTEGHGRSAA